MYDSLVQSYLTYGLTLWGSTYATYLNPLQVLQKKAVRCIHNAPYNAHTQPLFLESQILYIPDLYSFEISKFMYSIKQKDVPQPLLHIFPENNIVHPHNTWGRLNPHILARRTVTASNSILHKAPPIWNAIPLHIKEQKTRTAFKRLLKTHLIRH